MASRLLQGTPKLKQLTMKSQFVNIASSSIFFFFFFFWRCRVFFGKFSHWSKYHFNIITYSGIMTVFVNKGLNGNPEIGSTPIWVLPNIWRLAKVRDTKFGAIVSNKRLLNAANYHSYSCCCFCFWVIKGKPIRAMAPKTYNHFDSILKLFYVFPSFPFSTSKTMRGCYL